MITDSTTQGLSKGDGFRANCSGPAIPEHDELAMASHGRGFWVLDKIAPLRQAQPGITERVRWGDAAVPPGTYAVRLTVNGQVAETEVEVRRSRWITDVTDEDLVGQYEFGMRIRDQVDAANSAVIAIRGMKAQLDERLAEADDDETLIPAAERLRTAASAVEAAIYEVRNRSNQDPLNFPIKLNNRWANLLSMSAWGDGRPGSGMYAVLEIMVERLEGLLGELEAAWEGELGESGRMVS